jgi:hypothetical protein
MSGLSPGAFAGYQLQASPAMLAESSTARVFPVQTGLVTGLAKFNLTAAEEFFGTGVVPSYSFELKNPEPVHLPAGTANIYRNGEYVGNARFEGLSSGRTRMVTLGR